MLQFGTLSISVTTDKGPFGLKHHFQPGMNIIRAKNYAGKSTALKSMIYAIGLEGMFSPSQDVPLPHVLTNYIDLPDGNAVVSDSWVSLELLNAKDECITVSRSIAGPTDRHLISVRDGAAISAPDNAGPSRDYFVRSPRAAVSSMGFHNLLAEFMDWKLPKAAQFEGDDSPLYMETLFPLLCVEQKLGWGRIPARFPTWLGVRDVRRRTVEFLLRLDAYAIAAERIAVATELARIRVAWSENRTLAGKRAASAGATLNGIPNEPATKWPPEVPPQVFLASRDNSWEPLPAHLSRLLQRQEKLRTEPIPAAGENDDENRAALAGAEDTLSQREIALRRTLENLEAEISEADALQERISSLREDQRKYKDLLKLRELGSTTTIEIETGSCPTCHQPVSDSLMDLGQRAMPMSVEQNISFYEEQFKLFEAVLANARSAISASEAQVVATREELDQLRARVRSLRETLTSASNTPSIDALSERLRLDERIENLKTLSSFFQDTLGTFANLSDEWNAALERRRRLPAGALSENDEAKLDDLQNRFQGQLTAYGFGSSDEKRVTISRTDYEPELSDINLAADSAASDVIRLQWAYLLSLLEVGVSSISNHPRFLILDEPQQQSVEEADFLGMLRHAALMQGCQVIIATSHEKEGIAALSTELPSIHLWELGESRMISKAG
jgi:predicted  nucleic acid-binding Zn-ribbon protein